MCTEILVKKDGREIYCENVGQLADALSMPAEAVSEDPRNGCLCNAFLDELGARHATEDEGFPFPELVIEVAPGGRNDETTE